MRTLYEDWQLRRERLNTVEPLPHFEEQAKVLDYLLSRYKDDPVAHQPARFSLRSDGIQNTRDAIVQHYLLQRQCGATLSLPASRSLAGTIAEAHTRARTVLQRMAKPDSQRKMYSTRSPL